MHNERYPEPISNFSFWYGERLKEIERASSPEQIEGVLRRIAEYADAKWCFPSRLVDAQAVAANVRKKHGWQRPNYTGRMTGEGEAA